MKGDAKFSENRKYRYWLTRTFTDGTPTKRVAFIMLNPSTATETVNDPSVRRCIGYADDWGMHELVVLNLFAFRGTDPRAMKAESMPVGDQNNYHIHKWCSDPATVAIIAAWGAHGGHLNRDRHVCQLLRKFKLKCLGVTKEGFPKHPLYLRADAEPIPYKIALRR
jgi:hypothetical protein